MSYTFQFDIFEKLIFEKAISWKSSVFYIRKENMFFICILTKKTEYFLENKIF